MGSDFYTLFSILNVTMEKEIYLKNIGKGHTNACTNPQPCQMNDQFMTLISEIPFLG